MPAILCNYNLGANVRVEAIFTTFGNSRNKIMIVLQATTEQLVWGIIKSDKLVELSIGGIITAISILGSAYLAYRYALKKLKKETPVLIQRELYSKHINALQDLWGLLQYTTDNENAKSILRYEIPQGKDSNNRTWFFIIENGEKCREEIVKLFYNKGVGLFLSKEIKELIFEYDRQLYGFLLREKDNQENKVQIKNNKLAERMQKIHQEIAKQLKQEVNRFPSER